MQVIDTTQAAATHTLVAMHRHVPALVDLGRPLVAQGEPDGPPQLLTTTGTWWAEPDGVVRVVGLDRGRVEVTRWRDERETERTIGRPTV